MDMVYFLGRIASYLVALILLWLMWRDVSQELKYVKELRRRINNLEFALRSLNVELEKLKQREEE